MIDQPQHPPVLPKSGQSQADPLFYWRDMRTQDTPRFKEMQAIIRAGAKLFPDLKINGYVDLDDRILLLHYNETVKVISPEIWYKQLELEKANG